MKRREAIQRIGEKALSLGFLTLIPSDNQYQFFSNYDVVFNPVKQVHSQVTLPLYDQTGNFYQVVVNQWDGYMLNYDFQGGPIFYEYLWDDPYYRSPWTAHPERYQYRPITAIAQSPRKKGDGTFAYLPTTNGDGVFIISSPIA